uniref:C2 domain-containing protein n=1 Tax=Amphiprion ocellaris TaxID=80972 RepID=A0AAQ5YNK8_AMPOC
MSLADQGQRWFPTSVQVTVHQARNLRVKGKNGTNDSYAIIQMAKDKFSTSVAEKCVDPVWKEEASFDLPLFHPGNAERCTLYITVMHRPQVGLDKFLGQAVINLLNLHDDKSRKKTEWFKLVDKSGKEDKARGEVLLDIQFMRNNMSASMFDLSMQDKPRSRISKLKDKVRGKKKDGFSDSASAIVPPVSQVLTDSEGEADAQSLNHSPGAKKKSKLKTLFAPKSNLQRNISQSMSTLGTLPEKNSSLSGSRSSGLNVDSPDVKKKFKFLGHKRTGSSDSKVSLGPFSLLGRSKQSNSDLNNLCINGSHVYTEEEEPKSGSTLSLNSSGQGSVEDVRKHTSDLSADSFKSVPVPSHKQESADRALLEQQRHQEEEERRQAEERRIAEARRQEEEEKYRAEEQKRQEEASMSDRLSTLFGMIRKKEEKKEEVQQQTKEDLPTPAPRSDSRDPDPPVSHRFTNPFEDVPFSSDPPPSSSESITDNQKTSRNPQPPSAMVFLNRTAKVSAVKPRFTQSLESEPADCQTPSSQLCPSPTNSESTLSIVPSESPDTFSNLHSSLAPPHISESLSGSPRGSTEDLSSVESSLIMADQKRRALLPPTYPAQGTQTGGSHVPREIKNPAYVEVDGSQQGKKMSLPLPDYETLFPQKRHGVQGQTRWDHIIAEVNQRHRDSPPELLGPEMSVDAPEELSPSPRSSITEESPAVRQYQTQPRETKPVSTKKVAAPAPPKPVRSPSPQPVIDLSQRQSQAVAHQSFTKPTPSAVPASAKTNTSSRGTSRDAARKVLHPSPAATPAPRPPSQVDWASTPSDEQEKAQVTMNKEAPTAKPRQRNSGKEPTKEEESAVNSNTQKLSSLDTSNMDTKDKQTKENFVDFDPFPSTELLSKDPWGQLKPIQEVDDFFVGNVQKEQKPEDQGMTADDLNKIFDQETPSDPFANFTRRDSDKPSEYRRTNEDLKQGSPVFQRRNSQRGKKIPPTPSHSENKTFMSQQEPANKVGTSLPTANQEFSLIDVTSGPVTLQPQAEVKTQNSFYVAEDPFGAEPFTVPSAVTSSQPIQVVMEEAAYQAGGLSGGKSPLRAWVSPSEVQAVSTQNSNGGGLAVPPRRPHPVKPMSSAESQHPISTPAVKEIKVRDIASGKTKVGNSAESGPYTQLTQEELITLVVKQQADLSKKDAKIVELEEYIDNLLVRVIEEQPSILHALNATKPV